MFLHISETITQKLEVSGKIQSNKRELYRYGIQQGLTILLNFVTFLIIGVILNMFWQSLFFLIGYMPLRSFAGGYHACTAKRCYVFSIILVTVVLILLKFITFSNIICIIVSIVSFILIALLAPVAAKNKPLDNLEYSVYKRKTIVIAFIELMLFFIFNFLEKVQVYECFMMIFMCQSVILLIGKWAGKDC